MCVRPLNLKAPDWRMNSMRRMVSHSYGYGLMDATAMVRTARNWRMVPRQEECEVNSPYYYKVSKKGLRTWRLEFAFSTCIRIPVSEALYPVYQT